MGIFTLGEASTLALGLVRTQRPVHSRAVHCTFAPVRRDSIEAGTFEELFFTVPAKGEPDRLVRMARAALDAGRRLRRSAREEARTLSANERALVALTAGAVRVYEEICMLARLNAGRVFPSYDHLAKATALGRATIARALVALEAAGFLIRRRRFKRVDTNGAGPRYAQTSNVYRPTLPRHLANYLPRWLRPPPIPDDVLQQTADRGVALTVMYDSLSCQELAKATIGGALGRVLAKLGAAIDGRERESQNDPQTLFNLFDTFDEGLAQSA